MKRKTPEDELTTKYIATLRAKHEAELALLRLQSCNPTEAKAIEQAKAAEKAAEEVNAVELALLRLQSSKRTKDQSKLDAVPERSILGVNSVPHRSILGVTALLSPSERAALSSISKGMRQNKALASFRPQDRKVLDILNKRAAPMADNDVYAPKKTARALLELPDASSDVIQDQVAITMQQLIDLGDCETAGELLRKMQKLPVDIKKCGAILQRAFSEAISQMERIVHSPRIHRSNIANFIIDARAMMVANDIAVPEVSGDDLKWILVLTRKRPAWLREIPMNLEEEIRSGSLVLQFAKELKERDFGALLANIPPNSYYVPMLNPNAYTPEVLDTYGEAMLKKPLAADKKLAVNDDILRQMLQLMVNHNRYQPSPGMIRALKAIDKPYLDRLAVRHNVEGLMREWYKINPASVAKIPFAAHPSLMLYMDTHFQTYPLKTLTAYAIGLNSMTETELKRVNPSVLASAIFSLEKLPKNLTGVMRDAATAAMIQIERARKALYDE